MELLLECRIRIQERYKYEYNITIITKYFNKPCPTISSLINWLKKQVLLDFKTKSRAIYYTRTNGY